MDTSEDDITNTYSHNNSNDNNVEDAQSIKRRAIQDIMKNPNLDDRTKRLQVQQFMSGRQLQPPLIDPNATCTKATTTLNTNTTSASSTSHAATANNEVMKCVHYERKCNIVAPCCGKVFGCRVCHDEMSDHEMNRFEIERIICKDCGTEQDRS